MRLSEGLIVAHICLALSFLIGSSVFPLCERRSDSAAADAMVRFVCTCALGFAIFGFTAFFLLLAGVFTIPSVLAAIVAICVIGSMCWKTPIWHANFWRLKISAVERALDGTSLVVYYAFLILALPAINQVSIGSDAVGYHYVYAAEWARSGRLLIDPFLREPFYVSNFLLIYATLFLFGANVFGLFSTWLMGLLTALGISAAVRTILRDRLSRKIAGVVALLLTAAVVLSPAYLRWLDSGYIDVSIGAFALLSTLAIMRSAQDRDPRWLFAAAAIAGFLVGMKPSFLPLIVGYVAALGVVALSMNARSALRWSVLILLVVSAPWYIRNWVDTGDPIAPILNITLYGSDGLITQREAAVIISDLGEDHSIVGLVTLPVRAFIDANTNSFREYGTSALILLLYLPLPAAVVFLARGRKRPAEQAALLIIVLVFVGYWAFSSPLLRYSLLFTPLLALLAAMALRWIQLKPKTLAIVAVPMAAIALVPTPGSLDYYHQYYQAQYRYLPESYTSDDAYLRRFGDGYSEAVFAANIMKERGIHKNLYVLGIRVNYYLYMRGISTVGDWVGPAGYLRLFDAVDADRASSFMADLNVGAVLIDPKPPIGDFEEPLVRQLHLAGFRAVAIPNSDYTLLIKSNSHTTGHIPLSTLPLG